MKKYMKFWERNEEGGESQCEVPYNCALTLGILLHSVITNKNTPRTQKSRE